MAQAQIDLQYAAEQYNLGLQEAAQLGFTGKNAANYAILRASNNILYETTLPEITVTPGVKRKYIVDQPGGNRVTYNDYQGRLNSQDAQRSANLAAGMLAVPAAGIAATPVVGSAIAATLPAAEVFFGNPIVQTGFGVNAFKHLISENGVPKTINAISELYLNPQPGRKVWNVLKSATGDALDLTMMAPIVSNTVKLANGIDQTVKSINAVKNAQNIFGGTNTLGYAIKSDLLQRGANLAMRYPRFGSRILLNSNSRAASSIRKISQDLIRPDEVLPREYRQLGWNPRVLFDANKPVYDPNSRLWFKPNGDVAGYNITAAIQNKLYTPFLNLSDAKNYFVQAEKEYGKGLDFVIDFNKQHALNTSQEEINAARQTLGKFDFSPANQDLLLRYDEALQDAAGKGVDVWSKDFFRLASKHNISPDLVRQIQRNVFGSHNHGLFHHVLSTNSRVPQNAENILSLYEMPRLQFVNNPVIGNDGAAVYNSSDNTVQLTTKNGNHILRKIADSDRPLTLPQTQLIGHELDHWAQKQLPKVYETAVYDRGSDYYTLDRGNESLHLDFPELNGYSAKGWESSPHEWRSELVGYANAQGLPSDFSKWTPQLITAFDSFMARRFPELTKHLSSLVFYNYGPSESVQGYGPGLLVRKMFLKGYKQGGKINYLNYVD